MSNSVIAAQLYTVREFTKTPADVAETLKKVSAIGYRVVQISAFGPIDPQEVKTMLDGEGLTCCITHIDYDRLTDDLPAVIDQHKLWECKHVAVGSMPGPYQENGVDGIKKFAEEANEIGRKLHKAGLTFSYHNHSFEFVRVGDKTMMDILFEETDPRYVQAELDTYWVQHGGADVVQWSNKMKNLIATLILGASLIAAASSASAGIIIVDGYWKSNGTYVMPHYRTTPNHTTLDNLSNW